MYQTFEKVLPPISKNLKVRQKYSAVRLIFNSPLSVWKSEETITLGAAAQFPAQHSIVPQLATLQTLHVIEHKTIPHSDTKH